MRAFRLEKTEGGTRGHIVDLDRNLLTKGDTLVRAACAGINHKDALAGTGRARIAHHLPLNAGIEAIGRVVESSGKRFKPGDWVIAHGMGLGVERDGGLAEYLRADESWLVALPQNLKPIDAATLGVAGFSAALAIDRLEQSGVVPSDGPIAVTGATGGVGSIAIIMLCRRGFDVTAVSSKPAMHDRLRDLGANDVIPPPTASNGRPLERGLWAGSIDTVGGDTLAWLVRTTLPNGIILSIGNAGGNTLQTSVIPFILRGISLTGINANSSVPLRQRIWDRLASDLKPDNLSEVRNEINLADISDVMHAMIAGETTGRYVVNMNKM